MNFDIEAVNWDNEKRIKRSKIIAEEISGNIQIKSHYTALDFGCGTGLVSFNLYDKFNSITLIDTSKGMIGLLNEKIKDSGIKNMSALQLDINEDASMIGKFDVIYTSMALHHIKNTEATLKNLYHLLKDGGYLCIVELTEDDGTFHKMEKDFDGHNGFNPDALAEQLANAGFASIVSNVFYSGEKIIADEKVQYSLFIMVGTHN